MRTSLLILGLAMTSCGRYCEFTTNQAPSIPEKWEAANECYAALNIDLPCFAWWQQFEDPTLNELIDEGLLLNNQIQVAMGSLEAAQGELKRVQFNWIPGVVGNIGYSSFPDLGYPGILATVIPTYIINLFQQIKEQKKVRHELKATEAMLNSVRLAIIAQIASQYFRYIAEIEHLELLVELERDLNALFIISQVAYKNGLFPKINPNQAGVELHITQSEEKRIQQNIVVYQNSIQYLLANNPGRLNSKSSPFHQLNGDQMIIGALPLNIIENRPDMQQAKQALQASNEGIGIAFSPLLPTVNLSIARGEIGVVPNSTTFGSQIHFNQAILEIPLLQASVFGQLATAKGLNKASYYQYMDTLRMVLREVNDSLSAHDLYTKQLSDTREAEQNMRGVYELNRDLYQRGIISYFDLIETRIQLHRLAIEVNQRKLEQIIAIVNLYQDLAAGYNYIPSF